MLGDACLKSFGFQTWNLLFHVGKYKGKHNIIHRNAKRTDEAMLVYSTAEARLDECFVQMSLSQSTVELIHLAARAYRAIYVTMIQLQKSLATPTYLSFSLDGAPSIQAQTEQSELP